MCVCSGGEGGPCHVTIRILTTWVHLTINGDSDNKFFLTFIGSLSTIMAGGGEREPWNILEKLGGRKICECSQGGQ